MQKKKKDMQSGGFTPGPSSRRLEQQTDPNKQPVTNFRCTRSYSGGY